MRTEPIRIETDRVKKVRKHVETTRQTISGFIALAIDEKLEKETPRIGVTNLEFETVTVQPVFVVKKWMLEDIDPIK